MTEAARPGSWRRISIGIVLLLTAARPAFAVGAAPLNYLSGAGTKNYPVVALIWGLIAISLLVLAIVSILLVIGLFRPRPEPLVDDPKLLPPRRPEQGLGWIYVGTAISGIALFGTAIWTFAVLANVSTPKNAAPFRIEIIAHQWWWEARYQDDVASRTFLTANEIHIPTGQPVRFVLSSRDVIHSFWVPTLTGKTDTIPGQNNETWLEADQVGVYRGQCTEYCGQQHAHMGFMVVAQSPGDFQAWWDNQLKPAPTPTEPKLVQGQTEFIARCGICHTVRGTQAGGRMGPDLTHLMGRTAIAAATLPNTIGYLSGWIANPQTIKPGNLMPTLTLSPQELSDIRSYLETLQ